MHIKTINVLSIGNSIDQINFNDLDEAVSEEEHRIAGAGSFFFRWLHRHPEVAHREQHTIVQLSELLFYHIHQFSLDYRVKTKENPIDTITGDKIYYHRGDNDDGLFKLSRWW